MNTAADVQALILAGGQSRRFGAADKARHRIEGAPMIRRVYDAAAAVTDAPVLVSVAEAGTSFADCLPNENVRYVADAMPDAGPLAGLVAGLEAASASWVLAAACDLPFLSAEALRLLLDAPSSETDAVVAQDAGGRLQPLCAVYRCAAVLPVARRHLGAGRLALRDLLRTLKVCPVRLPDAALRNVNRPSDL